MKKIKGTKGIIISKEEYKMLFDSGIGRTNASVYFSNKIRDFYCYSLPLFSLNPKCFVDGDNIETDYMLIRPINKKLTESLMNKINKTWNELYGS